MMDRHKTTIRAIESFIFIAVSAFLSQIAVAGKPIDLSDSASQSSLATAIIAAIGIALRQWTATPKE